MPTTAVRRPAPPPHPRSTRALAALVTLALSAGTLAVYDASPAGAATAKQIKHRDCTLVSDALANGPTVTADPVGYAEAQVLPLKHLKLAYAPLKKAVQQLDAAYGAFSQSTGSSAAAVKVTAAQKRLDAICPTAAT